MIRVKQVTLAAAAGLLMIAANGAFASMLTSAGAPSSGYSGVSAGASDPLMMFSIDLMGNAATATLNTTSLGSGAYWASSGTLDVTAGSDAGMYSLFSGGPSTFYSPSGMFYADNVLLPGANPMLDHGGLLFTGGGMEVNIYGNSANNYGFWSWNGSSFNVSADGTPTSISLTVPEPGSLALLGAGLALLAVGVGLRRRRLS